MAITIPTNFKVNTGMPIDDRSVVDTVDDLQLIPYTRRYVGMIVYIKSLDTHYTILGDDVTGDHCWSILVDDMTRIIDIETLDTTILNIILPYEGRGGLVLNAPANENTPYIVSVTSRSVDHSKHTSWKITGNMRNVDGLYIVNEYRQDIVESSSQNMSTFEFKSTTGIPQFVLTGENEKMIWCIHAKLDERDIKYNV